LKIDILKIEIPSYKPVKPRNFYVAVYRIYEGNVCKKELLLRTEMSLTPHAENVNSAAPFN
jgi:hypothetical protein